MPETPYDLGEKAYLPTDVVDSDYAGLNATLSSLYGDDPHYSPQFKGDGTLDMSTNTRYAKQLFSVIDAFSATLLEYAAKHADASARDYVNPAIIEARVAYAKAKLSSLDYITGDETVQRAYYQTYKDNIEKIYFLTR